MAANRAPSAHNRNYNFQSQIRLSKPPNNIRSVVFALLNNDKKYVCCESIFLFLLPLLLQSLKIKCRDAYIVKHRLHSDCGDFQINFAVWNVCDCWAHWNYISVCTQTHTHIIMAWLYTIHSQRERIKWMWFLVHSLIIIIITITIIIIIVSIISQFIKIQRMTGFQF